MAASWLARDGEIVTFYSYKGGTGRTMALADVAWILASNGKRVLVVDWDLEAPGLHRYFRPLLPDKELAKSEGVLDMFWRFSVGALDSASGDDTEWYLPYADVLEYAVSIRWDFDSDGTIDLIGAGRQDASYSTRLGSFDWTNFYERLGGGNFLQALRRSMRRAYDYVLIDSRTGLSDTAGICTVELPDTLVLGFTMNIQSMAGAAAVGDSVAAQTKARILPVPMRVENGEHARLDSARTRARAQFGKFLVDMDDEGVAQYWEEIEVPYVPLYAYDELLAPVEDRHRQANTVLHAMERLTWHLTDGEIGRVKSEFPSEEDRSRLSEAFARDRRMAVGPTFRTPVRCVTAQGTIDHVALRDLGPLRSGDAELPARMVVDRRQRRMVQKWIPASLRGDRRLRALLEAEVHAGVRFAEVFVATRYPPELPRLVAYDVDGPEPFVLLEEYRGTPVTALVAAMSDELLRLYAALLVTLRLLEAAGVVHGAVSSARLQWNGTCLQLVDFEHATWLDRPSRVATEVRTGSHGTDRRPGDDLADALQAFLGIARRRPVGPPGPVPPEYLVMLDGVLVDGKIVGIDDPGRPPLAELQRRTNLEIEINFPIDPELELAEGRALYRAALNRKLARSLRAPARSRAEATATQPSTVAARNRRLAVSLLAVLAVLVVIVTLYWMYR